MTSKEDVNSWVLANKTPDRPGHASLTPTPTIDDQLVLRQLEGYFSCSARAAAAHQLMQDVKRAVRHFDPFAPEEGPSHILAFNFYKAAMKPTIEDFLSRAQLTAKSLFASCRNLRNKPDGEACVSISYVLACGRFSSFMELMRRVGNSQTESPGKIGKQLQRPLERLAAREAVDKDADALPMESSGYLANGLRTNIWDHTVDTGSTIDTDMAVMSPSGYCGEDDVAFGLLERATNRLCRYPKREDEFLAMQDYQRNHLHRGVNDNDHNNTSNGKHCGNNDEESDCGSEEEFPEPGPWDPADGGLPCLARVGINDWDAML